MLTKILFAKIHQVLYNKIVKKGKSTLIGEDAYYPIISLFDGGCFHVFEIEKYPAKNLSSGGRGRLKI